MRIGQARQGRGRLAQLINTAPEVIGVSPSPSSARYRFADLLRLNSYVPAFAADLIPAANASTSATLAANT